MFFTSFGSTSRLCPVLPPLSRSLVNRAASRSTPSTRGINPPSIGINSWTHAVLNPDAIVTPNAFLKAIGRSSETKVTTEKWEDFWRTSGHDLKKMGLAVRDRRYILWCMEKYRSGLPVQAFAHEPKPKKTVRGWGPAVQNGKRIRSRRSKKK